ncbi:MAG: hypothetical protein ACOC2W_02795, partial [bacterium]
IDNNIKFKKGRFEYGPGLYLTTHYDTALKYSKGSRKLYLVTVEKGNDLNDSKIDQNTVKKFIESYVITRKRNDVWNRVKEYSQNDQIPGDILNNVIINEDAIKSTNLTHLREFYINNGIDYNLIKNPFGWGELMMVLFNTKKIRNIIRVEGKDEITQFDLKQND